MAVGIIEVGVDPMVLVNISLGHMGVVSSLVHSCSQDFVGSFAADCSPYFWIFFN